MLHHFGEGNKSGYTGVQLIETSNIIFHLCDETGDGYFNIFSCKYFSENVARVVVEEWFKPEYVDMKVVDRDAKFPMA
jgi:S-adenosylmethionine/arginine decarboxylase-like enzyme